MLIWEAPSKRFLTLGPSRVVNPIHTKENKFQELGLFTRDWTSTLSDSWSDQSFKYNCFYPRCKCSLRNSYIIRNLKRLLFIEFCLDLLRGKFKAFCRFFATVNPLPPPFFSPLLSYTECVGNVAPLVPSFGLKKGVFSIFFLQQK